MNITGKKVRIFMQVDNRMLEISGDVSSFSMSYPMRDVTLLGDEIRCFAPASCMEADIHLIGNGAWSLVDDFKLPKKSSEWKCDFCGHVNSIKARYCGHKDKHAVGCGARRSFLLDARNE